MVGCDDGCDDANAQSVQCSHTLIRTESKINKLLVNGMCEVLFQSFSTGRVTSKERQTERESEGKKRVGMAFQMKIKMKLKCAIVCQSYLSGHS